MSCVWEVEYVQLVRKLNEVLLTDPVVKSKHYWWNTDICSALIFIALLHLLFEIWKSEANKAFYFIEQFFKSSHVVHIVLVSLGKSLYTIGDESSGENAGFVRNWFMWTSMLQKIGVFIFMIEWTSLHI